ncbi:MAG: ABC transporter permease [Acidobacteria bacterium]|nr:ABC transporter permease [Acidobacteriota bacterium]
MQNLIQDLRYGLRMLLKKPGFTLIAIITLALGIGANTAIFSVVNSVLLRPLPYPESDRLVYLNESGLQMRGMSISYPNFTDWRAQNQVFEKLGVFNRNSYNLTGSGEAERIVTGQMSADLFSALRVNPALGRIYTNEEDQPGGPPVVVLSYGLWQRRFGGNTQLLNQTLTFNGRGYTVIGVMPPGFQFPSRVEMWVPVGQLSDQPSWRQRGNHPGLNGVARLKPGVTLEQARADLERIAVNLEKQYPDSNMGNRVNIRPLMEIFVSDVRPALWTLLVAVSFVLLIACANVANLLLARAMTRQKEMALRAALGASRWRVVRQLLTESVLLSLIGGGLGLLLARWGVKLILSISPDGIPRSREIGIDGRVLVFTCAISILTGIIFGLAPALQASKTDVQEALKDTARTMTAGRRWVRSGLVVVEMALTLMLLIGAGLLIRSFYRLTQVNPGFSYDHLLSFSVSLPQRKYQSPQQQLNFYDQMLQKIRSVPGVELVGISSGLPLGNNGWQTSYVVEGQPPPPPGKTPLMEACLASSDYFKAMGIPLLRGRNFTEQDNLSHLTEEKLRSLNENQRQTAGVDVMIIDEEFARRQWPNEDAIGKRIRWGNDPRAPVITVVGVVGRVKMDGLNRDSNREQGYFHYRQLPFSGMTVTVKSTIEPGQMVAAVRQQVTAIDSEQPIYGVRTLEQIRSDSIAPQRLNLTLLGIFASVALALALIGIYGVMSYAVNQRTHEIGVRMALGAQSRDVLKLVVRQGMKLALAGVVIGLIASFALTRLMEGLLFGVRATDPVTYSIIALLLIVVALLACYVPARRATKVDPMVALRYE